MKYYFTKTIILLLKYYSIDRLNTIKSDNIIGILIRIDLTELEAPMYWNTVKGVIVANATFLI